MPEPISLTLSSACLIGYTALRGMNRSSGATSDEATIVGLATAAIVEWGDRSHELFGDKLGAISALNALAADCSLQDWDGEGGAALDSVALAQAETVVRLLPKGVPMPDVAANPDGSISLDWIQTRNRVFSLNISQSSRLAYAWLDGVDKGHGVAFFNGLTLPPRLLEGIKGIVDHGNTTLRAV